MGRIPGTLRSRIATDVPVFTQEATNLTQDFRSDDFALIAQGDDVPPFRVGHAAPWRRLMPPTDQLTQPHGHRPSPIPVSAGRSRPESPRGATSTTSGRELTALSLLIAFRRRWVPALLVGVPATLLVTALVWQLIPARYESSAVLKIQQFEQVLSFDTKERRADFLTYRDTQKAFIRSRGVVTAALRNPDVAGCRTLQEIDYPVDWLMKELNVDEQTSDEFLKISLEGEHPEDLALIVNAVKDAYMDEVVYNERNERIEQLRRLEKEFLEKDRKVRAAQENIDRLAESLGTGDEKIAVLNQSLIQEQLRDLQKDLREINGRIIAEEAARQSLTERGVEADERTMGGLLGTPTLPSPPTESPAGPGGMNDRLQRELVSVRQQIAQYRQQLRNADHPDLLALKEQERQLLTLLTGAVPVDPETGSAVAVSRLDWLRKQREKLKVDIEVLEEELREVGRRAVELEREKRDIELDQSTRDDLATQINHRRVELNAPQRITVVQDAHVPEKREVAKKFQLSGLSAVATFGCCVLGFTLFEWLSHRVGSTRDLTGDAGLQVLGTIPSPLSGGIAGTGLFARTVDPDRWQRAVTESMDVVRTYLMRHLDPGRPASILITSASANEGKTSITCQLAASLARTGKRVALVDCDFRRPSAFEHVRAEAGPGLSEYLRGEVQAEDIRQPTSARGLTFIPAGAVDQQVLQRLAGDGGRLLISELKAQFDFVLIDTSPLMFVAEPSMLAQNADIVLLATRRDYSRVPWVVQARDSLRSLQVPLLGAIMVGADSDFQRETYGYQQEISDSN